MNPFVAFRRPLPKDPCHARHPRHAPLAPARDGRGHRREPCRHADQRDHRRSSGPPRIEADRHLFIGVSDIVEPQDGHILPGEDHVERLLAFAGTWDRQRPMLIHCWAGISRSTAAAFITLCALRPERNEAALALALREASPSATPECAARGGGRRHSRPQRTHGRRHRRHRARRRRLSRERRST